MNENLLGRKFNRLQVKERIGLDKYGKQLWKCVCDCGKEVIVNTSSLTTGNTQSCGCYKNELIGNRNKIHGMSHTHIYYVWQAMRKRCNKEKDKSFKNYGARGIKVCTEWSEDFTNFYNWAKNNGYKQGLTLDRVNNNKGYSPENCRWVTMKQQANNTRRNKYVLYNNKSITIDEACKLADLNISTVYSRAKRHNETLAESFKFYTF